MYTNWYQPSENIQKSISGRIVSDVPIPSLPAEVWFLIVEPHYLRYQSMRATCRAMYDNLKAYESTLCHNVGLYNATDTATNTKVNRRWDSVWYVIDSNCYLLRIHTTTQFSEIDRFFRIDRLIDSFAGSGTLSATVFQNKFKTFRAIYLNNILAYVIDDAYHIHKSPVGDEAKLIQLVVDQVGECDYMLVSVLLCAFDADVVMTIMALY